MPSTTFLFAIVAGSAFGAEQKSGPLCKIVDLLGDMKSKITAEGEVEKEQFDSYEDWCSSRIQDLGFQIETNTDDKEAAAAMLEQSSADASAAGNEAGEHMANMNKLSAKLGDHTSIREKKKEEFKAASKELSESIDMLGRAMRILSRVGRGTPGALVQFKKAFTEVADGLSTVVTAAHLDSESKKKLTTLLEDDDFSVSEPSAAAYESHSTSILDTLNDLKNKAEGQLQSLNKEEMEDKHSFEMLAQELNNSLKAEQTGAGEANNQKAESSETAARSQKSRDTAAADLSSNSKYLADTQQGCKEKASLWDRRSKERVEELGAISKAIEILTSDEMKSKVASFKADQKSFIQTSEHEDTRKAVSDYLLKQAGELHSVGLAQLAQRAKADVFGKVKSMIADMIARLEEQAVKESSHNSMCVETKKKNLDKREQKSLRASKFSTRLDSAKAAFSVLKQKVADLSSDLQEETVAHSTAASNRNKELAQFKKTESELEFFIQTGRGALKALEDYYANAALVQQPSASFDGPVFEDEYSAKKDLKGGPVAIIEVVLEELEGTLAKNRQVEAESAASFEKMTNDYQVAKASLTTEKSGAEQESRQVKSAIQQGSEDLKTVDEELDAVSKALDSLKESCEYKAPSFEDRAAKRQAEIASLQNALEILENSGSFLQKKVVKIAA